jgi:hypothetical protein
MRNRIPASLCFLVLVALGASHFAITVAGRQIWEAVEILYPNHMESNKAGCSDVGGRALRYLEWRWVPAAESGTYVTDMAYVLRDERGAIEVLHDRHVMGLFSRSVWLKLIAAAGFEPLAVPFEHSSNCDGGHDVFLGLRTGSASGGPT